MPALRLIRDYLSNRKQRTEIYNYSKWSEIQLGVPKESFLGPPLYAISWHTFLYRKT